MSKIIRIILLLGILLLVGYYAVVFEPNNIKIKSQAIVIKNLPKSFDGVEIVHLSDFHSLWFGKREKRVLEIVEKLNPDFIFITGDFVDPMTKVITEPKLNSLKIFWQKLGEKYKNKIFVVLGNHDTKLVEKYLRESKIEVLNNESKKLFFGNEFIYLIGVDDPWTGRADLEKAMENVEDGVPKILLAHAPEIIVQAVKKKINLILVGHTHGGQVRIPFLGQLIQPLFGYAKKYTKGLFKIENTHLYVNSGVGPSLFPIRFLCPPEITLIELQK